MRKSSPPKLTKFPAAKQRRMDQLLDKNREGTITPKEKVNLEQLVAQAEKFMVANARRLAEFAERERGRGPTNAIPVTVRVQPLAAGQ